ncbi:MOSC domain-containing protein [Nocardiopsis sediminis]|uniref:MOSC domain-containing protein n=1 Tax=Nocardiopsis sediminis TaxID=1778267 RepID=A0ABV8FJE4_9ACTN
MGETSGTVQSVNTGRAGDASWAGGKRRTAIDKRPAEGPVRVAALGLAGDEQADRANHGGPDQAVYAFAREDLDSWSQRLGRPLRDGAFGENLTTAGTDVNGALIGEMWRIGSALFEAVLPRTPCAVFQAWLAEQGWVARFTQEARTGVYLRVLEEGEVRAGDPVEIVHRPGHGITVMAGFRAGLDRDIGLLHRILAVPGRSEKWAELAAKVERNLEREREPAARRP